jgi:hypothetical protein
MGRLLPLEADAADFRNAQIAAVPVLAGNGATRPEGGHR